MSAFARGFSMGQTAYQQMLDNKDREERRERERREFEWRAAEQARLAEARAREDAAFAELTNTQMGLQPATAAKITETYGMTPQQIAAAGAGLKQKLAEYDVPDSWDLQGGVASQPSGDVTGATTRPPEAPGLVPRRFTADQVELVAPSQLDMERALGRVAIARRDTAGIRASLDKQQALELDRKRKEYLKRLENMSPEELAKELGGMFSADGSGVEAMLTWAPDKKQFLWASNIPGFPSRTLTKAELINGAMAIWEQGNGDYNAGMQKLLDIVKTQRDLRNADRAESIALAKNAADLFYKDRELASADLYRQRSLGRDIREFVNDRGETVVLDMNRVPVAPDGQYQIPPGLRPKNANPTKPLTPVERAKAISDLVDAGYSKEFAAVMVDNMSGGTSLPRPGAAAPAGGDAALVEANNSRGKAANPAASIEPMVTQYNPAAFENFLSGAKRGDPTSIAIVKGWIQTNQLTAGQRKAAEAVVGR